MELYKVISKMCYIGGGNNIAVNNIATVHKYSKALDHFLRNMAMNHYNIDLCKVTVK